MVKVEIASISVSLDEDSNPCADIFVSKVLMEENPEIKDVVLDFSNKLVKEIFAKMDMEVEAKEYTECGNKKGV